MNSGAEGVETALKVARKWGYEVKGVPDGQAEIIVCEGNFHGRTTTIVSFSDDDTARAHYGPYTPGFVAVPYGDIDALAAAITDRTVGFLVEPIQGEAGVVLPPSGYLQAAFDLCKERQVLFIADEIQAGLGRAGATFSCDLVDVQPDLRILGKALGGGILPVSAVTANWDVLGVIHPGEHGSTFGGNPLAAAVGIAVIELLETGEIQERSKRLGEHVLARLRGANLPGRQGGARQRPVVGRRARRHRAHRPRGEPRAARARHPRQGHAHVDDPLRAAARGGGGRPRRGPRHDHRDPRRAHRRDDPLTPPRNRGCARGCGDVPSSYT